MSAAVCSSPALASTSAVVIRSMTRHCGVGGLSPGCEVFRKVDGLASPAGGKQPAEADLPDGEPVEQDFVPGGGEAAALGRGGVEQFGLPGLGGGSGEQDQPGTAAAGAVIESAGTGAAG